MIPVFNLSRQNKLLKKELEHAFQNVIESGVFILGENVKNFEKEFAKYIGVKYAVGVSSGTDAIMLALLALGIKEGDQVIMPANSYPSVFGVAASGALPVLVDVDEISHTLNPTLVEKAITKKTKAILPVHMYGQPVHLAQIMEIGKKYGVPVVEDCAQSAGTTLKIRNGSWKKTGSMGVVGCFSFYPTKNIGALGDGGMIVTHDKDIYNRLKLLRMYGEVERYKSLLVGKNCRLDELQAAILRAKLKRLDEWVKRRREIAHMYDSKINNPIIRKPFESRDVKHSYHLYVVQCTKREKLVEYLLKEGIGTGIHYPNPIHLQKSFSYLGYKKGDFPVTELTSKECLSLPMYPELTQTEVNSIVQALNSFS